MKITADGKKLQHRLIEIDATNWPPTITLASQARIRTFGRYYEITSATDPKQHVSGGEVLDRTGQREPWRIDIADLLRDQIPADDNRWLSRDDGTIPFYTQGLVTMLRTHGQTADVDDLMARAADALETLQRELAHRDDVIEAVRGEIRHAEFNGRRTLRAFDVEAALSRPEPGTPRIG